MGKIAPKLHIQFADMPSYWASYLINGDASGMEDAEQKQCDDYLRKEFGEDWDVVDCGDTSFFGTFEGLGHDLIQYTLHRHEPVEVWEVQHTDTYGGEANYSWVKREEIRVAKGAKRRSIMVHAMRAIGMSGVKIKEVENWGDTYKVTWRGIAQVAFVSFKEESHAGPLVISGLGSGRKGMTRVKRKVEDVSDGR